MKRLVLPVLIFLACLKLSYSVCPNGWFGVKCQYKCRCTENKCEPSEGTCSGGARCQPGWFGPACQYFDLAHHYKAFDPRLPVNFIIDGNENTCLNANEVTLSLVVPCQLSWFRAHVRDSYFLDKLKIQFKEQPNSPLLACDNKRTALVSDTALDIHCDLNVKVTQVILTGESLQSLCSFYISGGRNVALKQKTAQSSHYADRSGAENAVDGDASNWFDSATCTHTKEYEREADWNVTFYQPASVNRYVIYNRDEGVHVDERLQGFHLTSYDPAGAEVFQFIDTAPTEQVVYTVTSLAKEVQTVNIEAKKQDRGGSTILTLCEVEVYGDSVCEPGLYGRNCEHKCNCADRNDTCFVSTGGCPSGCPSGFQGQNCQEVCNKGWFGASCQYKCHCHLDLCDAYDGSCTQGVSCSSGWFGPDCQYEDLLQSVTLHSPPPVVIRDSNDHTCIDDYTEKVVIAWTIPYPFTWLRAVVRDPDFLSTLSLEFETNSGKLINCINQQQAKVNDRTVDIHCNLSEVVKKMILTGEGVKHLCSVYISGGRNVALKQRTRQTSTYLQSSISESKNAVDGNTSGYFNHGSCTHTDYNDNSPTWAVSLPRKLAVNRYVLYNRDKVAHRLQGFKLENFNEDGNNVFTFKDLVPTVQGVYTITSTEPASSVSLVTVKIASLDAHQRANFLTLCEVEIFGDSLCEPGLYGRECEHKCVCADKNDTCFVSTGGCPSGCVPGFQGESCDQVCRHGTHGPDCSNSCSQFCTSYGSNTTTCDHVHGACLYGCQPGYTGSMCYEECKNGHYGQNCSNTCSQLCLVNMTNEQRVCHHEVGTCLQGCKPGYTGPMCEETCSSGTYGQDCTSGCPEFCEVGNMSQPVCDHINGTCLLGCQAGYLGSMCDELCDNGIYGPGCSLFCSKLCKVKNLDDTICHHSNGTCLLGCQDGYTGPICNESCDHGTYGESCSSSCSQFCVKGDISESVCDHIDGRCLHGCQAGYQGPKCDQPCSSGKHGQNCSSVCPELCEVGNMSQPVCDHIHGTCLLGCQTGYSGSVCDESCDHGTYGEDCSSSCSQFCVKGNINESVCDHIDGRCLNGCQAGYQGSKCDQPCSRETYGQNCSSLCPQFCEVENMSQPVCDHIHGTCLLGCQAGYSGSMCDKLCDNGNYGPGCSLSCLKLCKVRDMDVTICHHSNGACLQGCQEGYMGLMCNQSCDHGTYGEACSSFCSQFCVKGDISESVCDHIDGRCLHGCQAGYQGPKCDQPCNSGKHGQDCSSVCPQFCKVGNMSKPECNHIHGTCLLGCQAGYLGSMCDESCDHGTYGEACSSFCSQFCVKGDISESVCDHIDGRCLHGCQAGYQGPKCDQPCNSGKHGQDCSSVCPQFCKVGNMSKPECNHIHGTCLLGCQAGYLGSMCDESCDHGTYGEACSSSCSQFCVKGDISKSVCDHIDGRCLHGCQAGYQGPKCDQPCSSGKHGQDCSSVCPEFCEVGNMSQPVCDHIHGTCLLGCLAGYLGSMCDESCDHGTYGESCSSSCSQFCVKGDISESVCDHIDGRCLHGCQAGYQGPKCDQPCGSGTYGHGCSAGCHQFCEVGNMSQPVCDHINGTCLLGCQAGYLGSMCDESCGHGTYGESCSSSCSQFCVKGDISKSVCDHIDGRCLHGCQTGYQGSKCDQQCDTGTYGQDCNYTCPQYCENTDASQSVCHYISGACTQGCLPGYKGVLCDEQCDRGTYGQDCNSTCSKFCEKFDGNQSVCDPVSGRCTHGCLPGYKGVLCAKANVTTSIANVDASRKEDSLPVYSTTYWAVCGSITVAVLVVVGVIVWRFKKGSYKMWTFNRKNLQKSDSTTMIMTTEMCEVSKSVSQE